MAVKVKHGDRMTVNVLGRDVELIADERVPKGAIVPLSVWEQAIVEMTASALAPDDYIFREGDFSTAVALRENCLDCNVLAYCMADANGDGPYCYACAEKRSAPKPTKPCEYCRYGINLAPCGVCAGTGRIPFDAPDSEDAYAHYCPTCGYLLMMRDGAHGEGSFHICNGERRLAVMYGFGHAIEKGLRAIAGWANTNEPQAPEPAPLKCDGYTADANDDYRERCLDCGALAECGPGTLCVYCEDRINGDKNGLHEYTEFWEHPSTLTALPVIDEDGDCFERPGFECP